MLPICAETTVSTYGSVEFCQFGTSAMVDSDFGGLGGYRTLEYEGQVPTKPYNCKVLCHVVGTCLCHPYIQSLPTL